MKANEAPEKIYISNFSIEALPKNEQLSERWHEVSTQDTDIEYTRTDAFIEKACEWLKENADSYIYEDFKEIKLDMDDLTETFKKAMED